MIFDEILHLTAVVLFFNYIYMNGKDNRGLACLAQKCRPPIIRLLVFITAFLGTPFRLPDSIPRESDAP